MLYNILEFKRILYFLLHSLDQPFLKVEKVELGYLSGGNLVRHNVNGVFGNDNILSSRLVELRNCARILILALNQ